MVVRQKDVEQFLNNAVWREAASQAGGVSTTDWLRDVVEIVTEVERVVKLGLVGRYGTLAQFDKLRRTE